MPPLCELSHLPGRFTHPMALVQRETGRKALYVNPAFSMRIEGWTRRESKPRLDFLFEHSRYGAFTRRCAWSAGSAAFRDNRWVWRFALSDYAGHRRRMRGVTIDAQPDEAARSEAGRAYAPG